jgi:predicted unusual protein kinase regulating ubiquinone biosynthesis (AarF/ABC1/UbiB family)
VWKSEFCNTALLFPAINVNLSQISPYISVLVRKASNGKAELVLLDHGLYEYLPPSVRQPLCRLWKAIVMNNHFDMKTHACALGVEGNVSPFDGKLISVNMALIQVLFYWWETELQIQDMSQKCC